MQDPGGAARDGRGVAAGADAVPARLAADQPHPGVVEEGVEQAHRIGAPADAGDRRIGQAADPLQGLLAGLLADDALEVAHHHWERMGAGDRAQEVVGGLDVRDPVPERLVDGVLEGARALRDGDDLGAEQSHPGDVQRLALGILLAHVDRALQAEQGGGGGGGHAMLAGPGLGDQAFLAHACGQQGLAQHIVDLVAAGVVQVLALEQDPRAAGQPGEAGGLAEQGGTACVLGRQPLQLGGELGVDRGLFVGLGELVEGGHQGLGQEAPTEVAEVGTCLRAEGPAGAGEIRHGSHRAGLGRGHCSAPSGAWRPWRGTAR